MLRIRASQVQVFRDDARRKFVKSMTEHAFAFQPQLCNTLGREAVRPIVDRWVDQADAIGFDERGQTKLFIELGLLFGCGFVDDPQIPWVGDTLADPTLVYPRQKAKALHERANAYTEAVYGPDNIYVMTALHSLTLTEGRKARFVTGDLDNGLLELLSDLHPQKLEYAGEAAIRALISRGRKEAARFGMTSSRAIGLLVVLMSAFGHRCADDRLYPWIGRTLTHEKIVDGEARAARLESRARIWLKSVIENHPSQEKGN